MNIISALTLHGINLKIDNAKSILKSLCTMKYFKNSYEKLLCNCFLVLNNNFNNLNYDDIDQLLNRIVDKYNNSKYDKFYNEEFCIKCALYTVEMDVGIRKAGYILKKFNRIVSTLFK